MAEKDRIDKQHFMTTGEVAELFRVSERTVRRWTEAGYFHTVKFGHFALIPRVEVEACLNDGATPPFVYRFDEEGNLHMIEKDTGDEAKGF